MWNERLNSLEFIIAILHGYGWQMARNKACFDKMVPTPAVIVKNASAALERWCLATRGLDPASCNVDAPVVAATGRATYGFCIWNSALCVVTLTLF